ncbi:MAG: ATP-binding cassette domain-containing protein, partial [Eubacterium sp.]|nr:ATP-binding cassette domain-containing protein [Eubacterium sp.]
TLKKPTEGSVRYNGKEVTSCTDVEREQLRRKEFGFVFQKHYLVPYMGALDNVMVAAVDRSRETEQRAREFLKKLGLSEREFGKRPAKLSGGQCQRTAIARAMINDPRVVFADEPTASLDHENAFNVMKILKEYSKDRLVLVVTHDRSILTDVDMTVEMWDGMVSKVS